MAGGDGMTMSKVEIDTSAPFRSVKEAVTLFGERVLAGQLYTNKLKELQDGKSWEYVNETNELEETKQSLQKARQESIHMALCLSSLQQELEQTKRELQLMKIRESKRHVIFDSEMEDLKFVENSEEQILNKEMLPTSCSDQRSVQEFQKKKYVTFANPPSVARVIAPPPSPPPSLRDFAPKAPFSKEEEEEATHTSHWGYFFKVKERKFWKCRNGIINS